MKANSRSRLIFSSLLGLVVTGVAVAQEQNGAQRTLVSKLYVAEAKGESQIQNGEQLFDLKQATAFDAPGSIIETKAKAHNAFVYSNGTGLFVDENTRVEITRFVQQPFNPQPDVTANALVEPSVSQSSVFVARGVVGICTNQLISGSSMLYATPHAAINIRGGRLAIATSPAATVVDLLEGDITVRHNGLNVGGQLLRPGERATIKPPANPGAEPVITIEPIPADALKADDDRVAMACVARRSVTFDMIARKAEERGATDAGNEAAGAGADQQIVANPTVPANPPSNIVISPDRLPGT